MGDVPYPREDGSITSAPDGERPSEIHPPTSRDGESPRARAPGVEPVGDDPIADLIRAGALDPPAVAGGPPRLGRFEVLGVLRAGGMGVVLRARDAATGEAACVKMIRPDRPDDGTKSLR